MTEWDRSFYVVQGYHKHSYPPPIAYNANLRYRFAIVRHSYREGSSESVFDAEFFLRLSRSMQACLNFDAVTIMLEDLGEVSSLHELSGIYGGAAATEREAPTEIYFRQGPQLICMEQTEFWCRCGGPDIYADSYTFSYYSMTDSFDVFAAACKDMCQQYGMEPPEVHTAASTTLPFIPWYKRPVALFGFKAW